MFRTMLGVALAIVFLAAGASAQFKDQAPVKDGKKEAQPTPVPTLDKGKAAAPVFKGPPAIPGEVEISLLNGSNVRMILQSDKLEIATTYGNLAVPSKEIVAIDFGLHFPDGIEAKIQQAIKGLGGDNFRERDGASKALVELGPYSFPAAFEASKLADLEVSRRAKEVVKQLQAKHPKKDLKATPLDKVITPEFTIVGRILTPTIKAKAELFGEIDMPISRMRTMRSVAGIGIDIDVTIDAGKYANAGQWMETEFHVDGRSAIVITAKGLVDTWPQQGGNYIVGPNGLQGRGMGMHVPAMPGRRINGPINGQNYGGMLIGRIGEDGEPFTIGERYEGTPETTGKLYLHIGPSPWNQQSTGNYEVKIARK